MSAPATSLLCALGAAFVLAACVSNEPKKADAPPPSAAAPASATPPSAAPAAVPAAAPAPAAAAEAPPCVEEPAKGKAKKGQKGKPAAPNCKDGPAAAKQESQAEARQGDGGYDLTGNKPVTDSKTVESGQGKKVKGINDWEGEISGLPAANSPFKKLRIGMPMKQVTDLIGEPSDQGAYITGKAFIPFYFGSDRSRWETVYRNHGRLIFSSQAGFGGSWHLTWIIHNPKEGPYR